MFNIIQSSLKVINCNTMCTVIYEFEDSTLLLCHNHSANVTLTSSSHSPSTPILSPTPSPTPSPWFDTSPSPILSPTPSPWFDTSPSPTPSPWFDTSPSPTPWFDTSPSSSLRRSTSPTVHIGDCTCQCSSPTSSPGPSVQPSPVPSPVSSQPVDLRWLHVLWCLPVFLLMWYRHRCCSKIKVGIAQRRYELRSKSWPRRRERTPAVATRSKSERFDSIVI